MGDIRFRVLGPLEAMRDDRPVRLGGPRPRAVLAALLLAGGRRVLTDALVDAVWGDAPPDTAVKTVQKYVSHLRAGLGDPDPIVSRPDGYELVAEDLDAHEFEDLIARAERDTSPERSVALLTRALDLWRGEPYPDLPDLAAAQAERRRLVERRLSALESLAEARLTTESPAPLVGWIEELVAQNPFRERMWGALMLALVRSGRQAEALAAYRRLRTTLVEELGVEPSRPLRELHERILRQDDEGAARPSRAALPLRLTSFVGREVELDAIAGLTAGSRLVTLTGPAGSGKTRLAVELLAASAPPPDGAWFVELAGVGDPARIGSAVAGVLRLAEMSGRDLGDVIAEHLAERRALLVLDNCEHMVDAVAAFVGRLLRGAAGVSIVATSRQPLGVPGEIVFDVQPLGVPTGDRPVEVAAADAVRLLADRARTVDPGFTVTAANAGAVARIARRLDGIPLALELAAARLRFFDAATLADLLDDRFRVLVSTLRTTPARHQTLRAAVAWSYDALGAEEQTLFRALCVCEGGFTLEAAEALGGAEAVVLLPTLVERSLVVVDRRAGGVRYRLLETLREYGRAQLDPDEAEELHRRHLWHHVDLAEAGAPQLRGPDQRRWLDRLAAEADNLRAALRWSTAHGDRAAALRLAVALADFWDRLGQFSEGTAWLREILAGSAGLPTRLRAAGLCATAQLAVAQGDHDDGGRLAAESLTLARAIGDEPAIAHATTMLGHVALYQGDYARARPLLEDGAAVYERLGMAWDTANVVGRLGHLYRLSGDHDRAGSYLDRAARLHEQVGDVTGRAWVTWQLGVLDRYRGDYGAAEVRYRDSLAVYESLGDTASAAHVWYSMGDLARLRGDHRSAADLYTTALRALRECGDLRCVASTLFNLGTLALDRAGADVSGPDVEPLLAASLDLRRRLHDRAGIAECLEAFAALEQARGEPLAAVRLLGAAGALREVIGAARPASDDEAHAARVGQLRAAVGADAFDRAWSAGHGDDGETVAATLLARTFTRA